MDICLFYLNVVFCIARFRFPEGTTCSCSPFSMNFFCLAADARSLTTWNDSPRHSSIHRRSGKNCTSVENSFRKSLDFSVGKMRREAWRTFFSHVWNKGCPVHDPNVAGNHGFYKKKTWGSCTCSSVGPLAKGATREFWWVIGVPKAWKFYGWSIRVSKELAWFFNVVSKR